MNLLDIKRLVNFYTFQCGDGGGGDGNDAAGAPAGSAAAAAAAGIAAGQAADAAAASPGQSDSVTLSDGSIYGGDMGNDVGTMGQESEDAMANMAAQAAPEADLTGKQAIALSGKAISAFANPIGAITGGVMGMLGEVANHGGVPAASVPGDPTGGAGDYREPTGLINSNIKSMDEIRADRDTRAAQNNQYVPSYSAPPAYVPPVAAAKTAWAPADASMYGSGSGWGQKIAAYAKTKTNTGD